MDVHYATIDEPATPEYVLAVLRDMHRQQCQFDDVADANAILSPEMTIDEWGEACDLLDWRELGRSFNKFWEISCSDNQWRGVLTPGKEKRLSDVCRLIAAHARRPTIRPATLFGSTCAPAGAFLTIRSLLSEAGVRAKDIAPSTALAPYARRHASVFLESIARLAPGALPLVRVQTPAFDAALRGLVVGCICLVVGQLAGAALMTIAGVLLIGTCYLFQLVASGFPPTSVEFGELKTFRDLALVVAAGMVETT
jgi:hypothetical protein